MLDKPRRLHPVAVLTLLIKNVYGLIQAFLPIAIVLLARGDLTAWISYLIPVVIVAYCAYTILAWWRLVYYVRGSELYMESGVITTKKRSIPFERIQGVQISEGLIQRLFGLVSLEVQTAGSDKKAEFSLSALTRQDAEELKALIGSGHIRVSVEKQENLITERLSTKALLQAASTSNGIGVIFFAIIALLSQIGDFIPGTNIYLIIGEYLVNQASSGWLSIILLLVAILAVSWIFSVIGSIIRLGGFTLTRLDDRIVIDRGILDRRQVTLPIKKIQAITITEGLLRQPFGLASVEVISAGYGSKGSEAKLIFPLMPKSQVKQFLDRVLPEFSEDLSVSRLPSRALPGYLISGLVITGIICAVIYVVPWAYLLLLPGILIMILTILQYLDAGYRLTDKTLVIRSRLLGRKTHIIPVNRIQWIGLSANPLQARAHLARLRVALMSQIAGTVIDLKGLGIQDATVIWDRLRKRPAD
ncbi:PH domain-containing protein [Methanocella sp. MCL-LM]|uniref:PH domain-containing protein n=1 Tax=Methanocella sp. MCL-LM TaxID=3412035 RepID=UPI003C729448